MLPIPISSINFGLIDSMRDYKHVLWCQLKRGNMVEYLSPGDTVRIVTPGSSITNNKLSTINDILGDIVVFDSDGLKSRYWGVSLVNSYLLKI